MQIGNYWALLLLLVIPIMLYLRKRLVVNTSVKVASIDNYKQLRKTLKQKLRVLPLLCRVLAILLLVFAIARPRVGREKVLNRSDGIAIEMVLDRSSSMSEGMEYNGRITDRLEVSKAVFSDFILGKDGLDGRSNDLVGIVSYARYSDTICPLTLDHNTLPDFLKQINLAAIKSEDGTAIGDAIELAAARLYTAEQELKNRKLIKKESDGIKSKIIILLTDGQDNSSRTSLQQAVKLCKEWNIKIYTIGVGGRNNGGNSMLRAVFSGGARTGVDARSLNYISENTGGKFFMADNEDAMKNIYKEIDELEKSQVESVKFTEYAEKFWYPALAALALVLAEVLLRATIFRVLP